MSGYFSNFKLAQYNNSFCKNIMSRAALTQQALNTSALYYPFVTRAGERPDTLAHHYYKAPEKEWMIFFANQIVDPYYQWYLTDEQLNDVIVAKYGSLARAQTRIRHYETNWVNDSRVIAVSAYESFTQHQKKYWNATLNEHNTPISYHRRQETLISNTNQIIKLTTASFTDFSQLTAGEDVYQIVNGTITASGTIITKDQREMTLQHIRGTFDPLYQINGADSNAVCDITGVQQLAVVIPADEYVYWTPVTYYEYEQQINESNKNLRIMDERYTEQAVNNLAAVMR